MISWGKHMAVQNPKILNIKNDKQIKKLKEILTKFGIKCYYEYETRKLLIKGKLIGFGRDYIELNYNDDIIITLLKFPNNITIKIENSITEEQLNISLPLPFEIWYVWPYLRIQF